MSQLLLHGKVIDEPIENILYTLRSEVNDGRLLTIESDRGTGNVKCTCPFHKGGHEKKPSMYIVCTTDKDIEYGIGHCFTCGWKGTLTQFVGDYFDKSQDFGEQWILQKYGDIFIEKEFKIEDDISFIKTEDNVTCSENLDDYRYYHPYMYKRHLTNEVIHDFSIGYDKRSDCLTFPVWDMNNRLLFVTRRSVTSKKFLIPTDVIKPVYLLNFLIGNTNSIYICEGQLDALNLQGFNIPAVATFGCNITEYQLKQIEKSRIHDIVICYDNDAAGKHGTHLIEKYFSKLKGYSIRKIVPPIGKDMNDLTYEQFSYLNQLSKNRSNTIEVRR